MVVLDGELAVPCNPKSAYAGLNVFRRSLIRVALLLLLEKRWTSRDRRLRTPSGPEGSSGK